MMQDDQLPRGGGSEHRILDPVGLRAGGGNAIGLVGVGVDEEDRDVVDLLGVMALVVGSVK
jgi:hypothetical protein